MGGINRYPTASVLIFFDPGFRTSPLYSSAHHLPFGIICLSLSMMSRFSSLFDSYPLNDPHRFSSFAFIRYSHCIFLASLLFPFPLPTFLIEFTGDIYARGRAHARADYGFYPFRCSHTTTRFSLSGLRNVCVVLVSAGRHSSLMDVRCNGLDFLSYFRPSDHRDWISLNILTHGSVVDSS